MLHDGGTPIAARRGSLLLATTLLATQAQAQDARPPDVPKIERPAGQSDPATEAAQLRRELQAARGQIAEQERRLADQERRLDLLERRLASVAQNVRAARDDTQANQQLDQSAPDRLRVGEVPVDQDRAPPVAVLDERGSVVTRKGQMVAEFGLDYSRADRNRAVFRGVELIEAILVGVFDINESRQDIITASGSLRYGLTDRLEIGGRVPFIYRSDASILAPIAGSTNDDAARTIDSSSKGAGLGDIELTARYQLNDGGRNTPFLIANMQLTLPTGRSPFSVRRDANGSAEQVATGAGFLGISPSLTAILPSEPAVLFGTAGYTFNLARNVKTIIPPVEIDRINPGDSINVVAGIGLALNDRTSINLGYAHSWAFGTTSQTRALDQQSGAPTGDRIITKSRDLQIGRLLFGITHRFSDHLNINWSVEVGSTQDAPDIRTSLRIPIAF